MTYNPRPGGDLRPWGTWTRGAFDDAADFARWGGLAARPGIAPGVSLDVSCGTDDPFAEQTRRYRRHVTPVPSGGTGTGMSRRRYWRSLAPRRLALLGDALAS